MISFLGSACFRLAVLPGVPGEEKPAKAGWRIWTRRKNLHTFKRCVFWDMLVGLSIHFKLFFVGVVSHEWILITYNPPKNTVWLGFSRVFPRAEGTHLLTSTEKVMGWQEEGDSDSDSLEPSPHDEHLWWQILDPHFPPGIQGVKISAIFSDPILRWKNMFHFFFGGGWGWYLI